MEKFYNLKYFSQSNGICNDDFKNDIKTASINLSQISSVTKPKEFRLPLSGQSTGNYYSIVTMSNGDNFYIKKDVAEEVTAILENYSKLYTLYNVKNLLLKYKRDVYAYLKIFSTGQRSPFHQDWIERHLLKEDPEQEETFTFTEKELTDLLQKAMKAVGANAIFDDQELTEFIKKNYIS